MRRCTARSSLRPETGRTRGYSADPTGERSYALLAEDAVAAVRLLRSVDAVDAGQVGVWGVSEGGWVAPLAANRSDDIAFVVTMSGTGIAPTAQVAWSVGRALEYGGIHARSMQHALTERLPRFIVSAEMMGEATYDPVPATEALTQPYLAQWEDACSWPPSRSSPGRPTGSCWLSDASPARKPARAPSAPTAAAPQDSTVRAEGTACPTRTSTG